MTTASNEITNRNLSVKPYPAQSEGLNVVGTGGFFLQAKGLTFRTRMGVNVLSDISFHIEPGELVILTGPSCSGKSTLLQSLAGYCKPTSGEIIIDGVSLYHYLKAFRPSIGYVPSEFAFHQHLSVIEILQEGARLRLPRSATHNERKQRVQSLLESSGLVQVANSQVRQLSRLDKRRLSIAVELIGFPGLLLVDKPAEPLSPIDEAQITSLLRDISRQNLTIIQVNDLSRCIKPTDKIIFMTPGGSLAWIGPAEEAFLHIQSFTPGKSANNLFGLDDALEVLADTQSADGPEWAKRFKSHPAYQKYVDDPLNDRYPDLFLQSQPLIRLRSEMKEKLPPSIVPRAGGVQKLLLMSARSSRLWWREKTWLLMLAAPLLIALVDFVLSSPTMSDPQLGDPDRPPIVLGLLVFLDLLVSALLFHNEIFRERAVYQRESRANTLLLPYILSKAWLVGILGIYQGLVWTIIHYAATGMGGNLQGLPSYAITFTLVAWIGGILGLIASALSRIALLTTTWVLVLTIPQLFLSGSIIPLAHLEIPFSFLSAINPSRYAFETLLTSSGYGKDIATDACWKLPIDQRNALSDAQKKGCTCMGDNIFSICKFPGIQAFYSYPIEQPIPLPPVANNTINNIPVQPLPKQGETLDQYAAEVSNYTAQIEIYQGNFDDYLSTLRQFSNDLVNWQRSRSLVIGNAEGVIDKAIEHYGQGFNVNLTSHWAVLAAMSLGLVILLFGIQQRMGNI